MPPFGCRPSHRWSLFARGVSLVVVAIFVAGRQALADPTRNGFVLAPSSMPAEEILPGGPPRDGIPALFDPPTTSAESSPFAAEEFVIGVAIGGEARAYPLAILEWHELVNDTLAGRPILVSYCPLCGTAMVFDRRVRGGLRSFGVSGLLYLSDLLLYDRETRSLWSQVKASAVTGASLGERLVLLRSSLLRLGEWRALHPSTSVLSPETGHARQYGRSPYGDYAKSEELFFPVPLDRRHHPKTPTVGLRLASGHARAYPAIEVVKAGGTVAERFADREVRIRFDPEKEAFSVEAPPDVEVIEGYYFAWLAFHPESSVFESDADGVVGPARDGAATLEAGPPGASDTEGRSGHRAKPR
ncbi:hypothetical protein MYXO_01795 [Myxococcaceae bacterium]|jgi:hypothetical protein|nr:hypothetical protein MYXO_01795 [Myxococcaceae bacterium]